MASKGDVLPASPGLTSFGVLEKEEKSVSWLGQALPWSRPTKPPEGTPDSTIAPEKQGASMSSNAPSRPERRPALTEPGSQRRGSAATRLTSRVQQPHRHDPRKFWMPDNACKECSECGIKFSLIIRRHHCRVCGRIFCSTCSTQSIPGHLLGVDHYGNLRACRECVESFQAHRKSQRVTEVGVARQQQQQQQQQQPQQQVMTSIRSIESPSLSQDSVSEGSLDSLPTVGKGRLSIASNSSSSSSSLLLLPHTLWGDEGSSEGSEDEDLRGTKQRSNVEFDNPAFLRMLSLSTHASLNMFATTETEERLLALDEEEAKFSLQDIWASLLEGLSPQNHRYRLRTYPNSFIAHDVVDWLMRNQHAGTREIAVRIGQALVDTKRLKLINSVDMVFRDDYTLFLELGEAASIDSSSPANPVVMPDAPKWFQRIDNEPQTTPYGSTPNLASDLEQSVFLPGLLQSTILSTADQDVEYRTNLSQPQDNYLVIEDSPTANSQQQGSGGGALSSGETSGTANVSSSIADWEGGGAQLSSVPSSPVLCDFVAGKSPEEILSTFQRIHDNHFDALMIQMVRSLGLSLTWIGVIKPLVIETCQQVRTNLLPDDVMDINQYIKVKKIPGGKMADSAYIYGVVYSKNVTHKKMRTSIDSPTIMLLRCAFEFQRKENQFSSLDTLQLQEYEYLKNVVAKIKKFRPSIILVQKSVSRIALDMLQELGIVVAVNVKPVVMTKVARSTNATLLHSLDQLSFNVRLGTCGQFYVRSYSLPDGCKKTLMYFDQCDPAAGCAITLRGGELRELKKVKRVARFALHMAYNSFLESSFLADGFSWPLDTEPKPVQPSTLGYCSTPSTPEWPLYPVRVPSSPDPSAPVHPQDLNNRLSTLVEMGSTRGDMGEDASSGVVPLALPFSKGRDVGGEGVGGADTGGLVLRTGEGVKGGCIDPSHSPEVQFQSAMEGLILSISPNTHFTVPYVLTQKGRGADVSKYLCSTTYWSNRFSPNIGTGSGNGTTGSVQGEDRAPPTSRGRAPPPTSTMCPIPCHDGQHRYRSVSEHPFTGSIFLSRAGSSDMKAVLADFRARAGLFCEDQSFFFPSAHRTSDYKQQVTSAFAKYRHFEAQAADGRGPQALPLDPSLPPVTAGLDPRTGQSGEEGNVVCEQESNWTIVEPMQVKPDAVISSRLGEFAAQMVPRPISDPPKGKSQRLVESVPTRTVEPLAMKMEYASLGDIDGSSAGGKSVETKREGTGDEGEKEGEGTGEQLAPNRKLVKVDCLDPIGHQGIQILFSSTCHDGQKHQIPCVSPCIIPMSYYGRNDIPLGEFLQRYCFRPDYKCQTCDMDMLFHQRHMIHGDHALHISIETWDLSHLQGSNSYIYTSMSCRKCDKGSPPTKLSDNSLLFSFAKMLELKFYGSGYTSRFHGDRPSDCTHSLLKDYVQYFFHRGRRAAMQPASVIVLDVRVPPRQLVILTSEMEFLIDLRAELDSLEKTSQGLFYRILQRLKLYQVEPVVTKATESIVDCKHLRQECQAWIGRLKALMNEGGFNKNSPMVCKITEEHKWELLDKFQDGLVSVKQFLLVHVLDTWNSKLEHLDTAIRLHRAGKEKDQAPPDGPAPQDLGGRSSDPPGSQESTGGMVPGAEAALMGGITTTAPSSSSSSSDPQPSRSHIRMRSGGGAPVVGIFGTEGEEPTGLQKDEDTDYTDTEVGVVTREGVPQSNNEKAEHEGASDTPIWSPTNSVLEQTQEGGGSSEQTQEGGGSSQRQPREMAASENRSEVRGHSDSVPEMVADDNNHVDSGGILSRLLGKDDNPSKFYMLDSSALEHTVSNLSVTQSTTDSDKKRTLSRKPVPSDTEAAKPSDRKTAKDRWHKSFMRLPHVFDHSEHHNHKTSLSTPVSIFETEPTSIIAFALSSQQYATQMSAGRRGFGTGGEAKATVSPKLSRKMADSEKSSTLPMNKSSSLKATIQGLKKKAFSSSTLSIAELSDAETSRIPDDTVRCDQDTPDTRLEEEDGPRVGGDVKNEHISLEFSERNASFYCKVYFAEDFKKLREKVFPAGENRYLRSLSRCVQFDAKGGKSRSTFCKTIDGRLIMKQIQAIEISSFEEFAQQYIKHVASALDSKRPLLLAKILGIYTVGFKNTKTGNSKRLDVVIMENILYGCRSQKVFDLKGSMRSRYVDPSKDRSGNVLLDENYLNYICNTPVYVHPHSKRVLMEAISVDTQFLAENRVMDYSLLACVEDATGELVLGIIDFVRTFTLDKRLEMYVKKSTNKVLPTVVYPELYRKRFCEAMERYFTVVPDKWTGLEADVDF